MGYFILIMSIFYNGAGTGVATAEFYNKESCMEARDAWLTSPISKKRATLSAICVEK